MRLNSDVMVAYPLEDEHGWCRDLYIEVAFELEFCSSIRKRLAYRTVIIVDRRDFFVLVEANT